MTTHADTTLVLHFPTGRYHATPWGHHVNEGLVEWPPSPWRLLRALIAVGHQTLRWGVEVPAVARELIEVLASAPPRYRLPAAGLGHTRHYMPIGKLDGEREKTTLVFDAFARPGEGTLSVTWPVVLTEGQRGLLERLAANLAYLGRAESWVEARLLAPGEAPPDGAPCEPSGEGPVARGWEAITLLAPLPAGDYAAWREAEVEALLARPELQPPPGRKVSATLARKRSKALAPYPQGLWEALCCETAALQAHGWSQPPGSRRLGYLRPSTALQVSRLPAVGRPAEARVEAMLLALSLPSGNRHALPPVTRTLPQAELLHRSVVSWATRGGEVAHELVGRDADRRPLRGHRHVHTLPLDLDGDGHLDHVLLWAPGGLGPGAQEAVRHVRRTWTKKGADDLRVAVAASGSLASMCALPGVYGAGIGRQRGPSIAWRSETPFVPPRFMKRRGRNTLEGQVQAELDSRGLPPAVAVRRLGREELLQARFRHFVRARSERRGGAQPPVDLWFGLEITFESPVQGPLCLGYGAHFGLGRFRAV